MSVQTIVESTQRWTCDGCGAALDVRSGETDPIADWIVASVHAIRPRSGECRFGTKHCCGSCSVEFGLRPGSKPPDEFGIRAGEERGDLASAVPVGQDRTP